MIFHIPWNRSLWGGWGGTKQKVTSERTEITLVLPTYETKISAI